MGNCIMISDASVPAMGYERNENGKFSLWCLTEVHGMGMGEMDQKYLNKDFDDILVLESWNLTSYVILKSKGGWGMIRVDGDGYSLYGLVSEVSDRLYPTLFDLQQNCSMAFLHFAQLKQNDYFERKGETFHDHKIADGITPAKITHLRPNDVFVFGSNLAGMHSGGAARTANKYFGAEWGVGEGHTGQSYAIPTMRGSVDTIKPYIDRFIQYTKEHPELHFFVTPIGCGNAGFEPKDIAPLFKDVYGAPNVNLPMSFISELKK